MNKFQYIAHILEHNSINIKNELQMHATWVNLKKHPATEKYINESHT